MRTPATPRRPATLRTLATMGAAALTLTLLGGTSPASAAPGAPGEPAIPLNGEQEPDGGHPDGAGFFTYDLEGTTFCYTLRWDGIAPPFEVFAAHVHVAPREVNGPIVIPLSIGDGSGALVEDCAEDIDPMLAADIAANPSAYYVNVHARPDFQGGAIRGQLK